MFITFEGPEGAGKSTVIRALTELLRLEGRAVTATREPGAGEFGARIRAILLEGGDVVPEAELFLFLADRSNHVRTIIRPPLERGEIVLCDRFADSTFVYQAVARGLDSDFIRAANAFATGGLTPDITFLLDLDPAIGLARLTSKDRMDALPLAFHERVRQGFLDEASREPGRWRTVDATQTPDALVAEIREHLRIS